MEYASPQWIPMVFHVFDSVLWKHGDAMVELMREYPMLFTPQQIEHASHCEAPVRVEQNRFTDAWGCEWLETQPGMIGQVVGHPLGGGWSDLSNLQVPDPEAQWDWAALAAGAERTRAAGKLSEGFMDVIHGGFFDRLQFLRGLDNLLVDFLERPPEFEQLIATLLDYNMRLIRLWLEVGIDVLHFHGDIATQSSLMMRPETFRSVLKPAYAQMFQACRQAGVHVKYSADGNLLAIVDDLIECGVSYHDPQVRACTIDGIARAYKGRLCAMVDIDQQMLPFCSPGDIDDQVREIVEKIGLPEGGLMLYACPTPDVPMDNIDAICRAWQRYGGPSAKAA